MKAVKPGVISFQKMTLFFAVLLLCAGQALSQAQVSTADLSGTVVDPNDAVVAGATVTAVNLATRATRTVTSGSDGTYQLIGLPPGEYEITSEAATFKKVSISPVRLTVGQSAELKIRMEIGGQDVVVTVSGDAVELIETARTTVANTIDEQKIDNLPINERSATGFALTLSTVGRDNGRPIGPAPTSGLNIGGQRGRSTQVNVDGVDFTDNSVNAARSTVGQEAVQEYQIATNSYAPEFGRATGGVVNVVTKRGTNEYHGNVFGFLRDKAIQARNPFAPGPGKPNFTRAQYGATLGGPIFKDRTFFFAAFEGRQRRESGFFTSNVFGDGTNALTSAVTLGPQTYTNITAQQAAFANALIQAGQTSLAGLYLTFVSSGGQTALTGTNPLRSPGGSIPAGQVIGPRFFLSGAPVPLSAVNGAGEPIAFRPLLGLSRVFPIKDKTHFFSLRGDHSLNDANQLSVRFGYNPSKISGIQVESQNQSLGQNDFSRTGISNTKDYSFTANLNTTLSSLMLNEARFSYGKRRTTFRSQNGDAVAYNISGTAFIGRELFSPVVRSENRYSIADTFNWVWGSHTMKFGGDISFVRIPQALFELNYAGLFNFGETDLRPFIAASLPPGTPLPPSCQTATQAGCIPLATPVQSYGLGLPSIYIQGFGNPISKIKTTPIAFFAQDSWKIHPRFTLNYGVRYDVELTETIAPVAFTDPLSGISLSAAEITAAQDVLNVQQGIPRDTNNWAPRLAGAWDLFGDGRTVLRGAIGLFYDHPLLAVAFNSDIADNTQQQQAVLTAGSPSPTALLNAVQVFQGTVCTVASANPICPVGFNTPGTAASAQYQFGRQRFNDQTFPGFGAVLPFVLPVSKDFEYAQAVQANAAIEHRLTKDMSIAVSYIHVGAHHLPHPTDLNTPNVSLQVQNFLRFSGGIQPQSGNELGGGITIATTAPGTTFTNVYGVTCGVVIPGMIAQCPTGRVITPAIANFFRPNAPNYFLAQSLGVSKALLDSQLAGTLRTPGLISTFGSVNAQISDGNSSYNALNVELKRRFANNYTFLATYTWSHSIDDSSDLQTLLIAQDVKNFRAERANSLFDQRHRFVFSGLVTSPTDWRKADNWGKRLLADFTVAPIIEISSGRPFNIITNVDTNNDQSSQTDRPDVNPDGSLTRPRFLSTGNLGRNMGITHPFASFDLRVSRAIYFGERLRFDIIAEGFNLFNRFNEASASPLFTDVNTFNERSGNGRFYSRPTASYDQRQFQLGLRLSF
jgi:hypothetical protein